jgi:hypothetical protein
MTSLILRWGVGFAALGWLTLRFCAAVVIGVAVVLGAIVVWTVAVLLQALVGDVPVRRAFECPTTRGQPYQ